MPGWCSCFTWGAVFPSRHQRSTNCWCKVPVWPPHQCGISRSCCQLGRHIAAIWSHHLHQTSQLLSLRGTCPIRTAVISTCVKLPSLSAASLLSNAQFESQDRELADEALDDVYSWQLGKMWEFSCGNDIVEMRYDGVSLARTGHREKTPRGIDVLAQMPSQKHQLKLKYAWQWCQSFAAELALSHSPAMQPSITAPWRCDGTPGRATCKPGGFCANWDMWNC